VTYYYILIPAITIEAWAGGAASNTTAHKTWISAHGVQARYGHYHHDCYYD
jgi:hypothetical protein